jgi:outer membrane biosynthesis protein TonB
MLALTALGWVALRLRAQSSSGSRELDKAAVSALSLCRFTPATNGGV